MMLISMIIERWQTWEMKDENKRKPYSLNNLNKYTKGNEL